MEKEFNYYVIEPEITERTPLLMNDPSVDPHGITFLYKNTRVPQNHEAHLQFLMPIGNPDMNTDYLFLETYAVFSKDVAFQLYHQSVVDIIKSVDPKGVQFIPIEEYVK